MVRAAGYWEKWRGVSFASRRTGRRKGFAYAGTWSALTLVSLRFFFAEKRARFKFPRLFRGWPFFDRTNVIRASALTSWSLLSEPTLEFGGFLWQIRQETIIILLLIRTLKCVQFICATCRFFFYKIVCGLKLQTLKKFIYNKIS